MNYINILKVSEDKSLVDDKNSFEFKKSFDDYIIEDINEGFYSSKDEFFSEVSVEEGDILYIDGNTVVKSEDGFKDISSPFRVQAFEFLDKISDYIPESADIKKVNSYFTIDQARIDLDYEYNGFLIRHPTVINIKKGEINQFLIEVNFLNSQLSKDKVIRLDSINELTDSNEILRGGHYLIGCIRQRLPIEKYKKIEISESMYDNYDGQVSIALVLNQKEPEEVTMDKVLEADIDDKAFQNLIEMYKKARDGHAIENIPVDVINEVKRQDISLEEYFEDIIRQVIKRTNKEIRKDKKPQNTLYYEELILEIQQFYPNILDSLDN